jgi:AmmeMemoRadiSam system protein A
MTDDEALATIAREALDAAVGGRAYAPEDPGVEDWRRPGGCFVTLKTAGRLRGCLGVFASDQPLYRTVAAYARHAALEDPRFAGARLTPAELPAVDLEISVLSPLAPCADPAGIRLGVDGVHIRRGGRSGCFLPQVATETGWTVEEFLGHCCRDKAGLDWDAWRDPATETRVFTVRLVH